MRGVSSRFWTTPHGVSNRAVLSFMPSAPLPDRKPKKSGKGDDSRGYAPPFLKDEQGRETKEGAYFCAANRGKKSITVNLSKAEGQQLVRELAASHELLVTVEENAVLGGAGSAVNEFVAGAGLGNRVVMLGLPDSFGDHGSPAELLSECGLDAPGIRRTILRYTQTDIRRPVNS